MTSALLCPLDAGAIPDLTADFEAAGIHVLGAVDIGVLVREAVRHAPDVVVIVEPQPSELTFRSIELMAATLPLPVLMFVNDGDVTRMDRALALGVAGYVVQGYKPQRLRPLLHLAQARFRRERELRAQLDDMSHRYEERKLIDRAKGVLMRARQMSEDEAFRVLRTASMHSNRRVGQVAQQIIESARQAGAVNRAGQLRMLSQRIVKSYALQVAGHRAEGEGPLRASVERIDKTLSQLGQTLSQPTFGDLLDAVAGRWQTLKQALDAPADPRRLGEVDAAAAALLQEAESLTAVLESSSDMSSLHVINVAGRQRMLSQRLAKAALLTVLQRDVAAQTAADELRTAREAFAAALSALEALPLATREIRASLDEAAALWRSFDDALRDVRTAAGQRALAAASEQLLDVFERLTDQYERSMQILMG